MDIKKVVKALTSMAQATRLSVLKILVEYGRQGAAAGVISKKLKIPHNTLSFHLTHLANAGLVTSKRQGRSIIYFAHLANIQSYVGYVMENCCISDVSEIDDSCKPAAPQKKKKLAK